jgi:hypothetical protein
MIVDRDFNLSLLLDSIKMQMGERRDWQSVKLPRQAGQPEQRFACQRYGQRKHVENGSRYHSAV